jgi:hypothetical protein
MQKSRPGPKPGTQFSEQHKQRIAEGMRAAHARRAKLQADFALKILAALDNQSKDHKNDDV